MQSDKQMQFDGEFRLIAIVGVTTFRCVRGILTVEKSTKVIRATFTH